MVDQKAVEYFEEKLKYETTPFTLNHNIEKGKVVVVDPRDDEETIPGAVSIPLAELDKRLSELPADKTIVVFGFHAACAIGPKAALVLARAGFKVQLLTGGFEAWKRKFPVTRRQPSGSAG